MNSLTSSASAASAAIQSRTFGAQKTLIIDIMSAGKCKRFEAEFLFAAYRLEVSAEEYISHIIAVYAFSLNQRETFFIAKT